MNSFSLTNAQIEGTIFIVDIYKKNLRGYFTMAFTKANLIQCIADQNGFTKFKASQIIESLLELIKGRLESGENILISGFGKFCVKEKKQRKGINPRTGDSIIQRPHRVVRFRCSGKLRNKVNNTMG